MGLMDLAILYAVAVVLSLVAGYMVFVESRLATLITKLLLLSHRSVCLQFPLRTTKDMFSTTGRNLSHQPKCLKQSFGTRVLPI